MIGDRHAMIIIIVDQNKIVNRTKCKWQDCKTCIFLFFIFEFGNLPDCGSSDDLCLNSMANVLSWPGNFAIPTDERFFFSFWTFQIRILGSSIGLQRYVFKSNMFLGIRWCTNVEKKIISKILRNVQLDILGK